MSLNGSLDGLVEELQRLLVQAEAEVHTHQQALDAAKQDAQRVRSMLKVAGVTMEDVKPKAKVKEEAPRSISPEIRTKVLSAIQDWADRGVAAIPDVPGSFVASDIKGDFHESSARTAIFVLRDEGILRAVGKKSVGRARAPMAYALVPVMIQGEDMASHVVQ